MRLPVWQPQMQLRRLGPELGPNRLNAPLAPASQVSIKLPKGLGCSVDIEADVDGSKVERRRVDTCALREWTLQ